MNCNIVINQQPSSLLASDRSTSETKVRDPERQRRVKKSHETYMKKLKEKLLKDNQEAQMTFKEFIEYFQEDLNDPASTLIAKEKKNAYYERRTQYWSKYIY